jgi:hypothetical protein
MADLDKIAAQVADVDQRVADVLDAARGKGARVGAGSSAARLLVLPSLNSRGFPPDLRGGAMSRPRATTIFACKKTVISTPISSTVQNAVGNVARRRPSDG